MEVPRAIRFTLISDQLWCNGRCIISFARHARGRYVSAGRSKNTRLVRRAWFHGTMGFFASAHIPAFLAFVFIVVEFFGSILLVLGLLTRLWALAIAVDMLVAVSMVHLANGFFMNWTGHQHGEGFEFHLFPIAIGIALVMAGPGRFSLDSAFATRRSI